MRRLGIVRKKIKCRVFVIVRWPRIVECFRSWPDSTGSGRQLMEERLINVGRNRTNVSCPLTVVTTLRNKHNNEK